MPGIFAHMLIYGDVIAELEKDRECTELATLLKENRNYGTLGSVGPDLPNFGSITGTLLAVLRSKTDEPFRLERWSGQMHTKDPNILPLKMIEMAWRENDFNVAGWDEISKRQWAFVIGYLSHIAADQVIHPFINTIAGQIYRSRESRLLHGNCEAYQDVVLYEKKKGKRIKGEKLRNWIDLSLRSKKADPFLGVFIQKAFIEAHGACPTEKEIRNWFKGLSAVFTLFRLYGPYLDAERDYQRNGEDSGNYREFWLGNARSGGRSYTDYYRDAVELATIYAKTANHLYMLNPAHLDDPKRQMFLEIVKNADLGNPLYNHIIEGARKAYAKHFGETAARVPPQKAWPGPGRRPVTRVVVPGRM